MAEKGSQKLAIRVFIAVIIGITVGLILNLTKNQEFASYVKPVGDVFIRLLKMIIVPLVFASVYGAVLNLGAPENLGRMGLRAIIYYTLTTSVAVFIGLVFVNSFNPGVGSDLLGDDTPSTMKERVMPEKKSQSGGDKGLVETIVEVIVTSVPTNPVEAAAKNNMLQIIVFALLLGMTALFNLKEAEHLSKVLESLEKIAHRLTHTIMLMAPYGVFALMVDVAASAGIEALGDLGKYMLVVMLGLTTHSIVLVFFGSWRSKMSPMTIFKGMTPAILTAFSTSSSAATLPVTMNCVTENLEVDEDTANFVLPLGATINMDGTALYVSIATVFIAQVYGVELSLAQNAIIFFTASLAAVGAAAIPGAGLITMGIVLSALGLPMEGISVVIGVDRILDMFRTTTNILGDSVGTIVVDSYIKND